jgi:60 kDa SS-A/Ro ribonucleoprotein
MGRRLTQLMRAFQPQPQPVPDQRRAARTDQVRNSAGGFGFALQPFQRLERFLILGVDGPTYYASARQLVLENAACVTECLRLDGPRTVHTIASLSEAGRAPKNDAAIFALALASAADCDRTRRTALNALPRVCRTGTHLFQFTRDAMNFRRWGRGLRRAVGRWYTEKSTDALVYQLLKYGQREGMSHRDVLRLSHPVPRTPAQQALFAWLTAGEGRPTEALPEAVRGFEALRDPALANDVKAVVALIRRHRFTHDMLPTTFKRSPAVWEALLPEMPLTALLRGLAQLTSVGLLTSRSAATKFVCQRLTDAAALKKARVHPIAVLSALRVYGSGHGVRGSLTWTPVPEIRQALDRAFELAFHAVEPTGRRHLLALDVSGSMGCGEIAGAPGLSPALASAAMAMVTLRREADCRVMGFSHRLVDVDIGPTDGLERVLKTVSGVPMGATDCALPMIHAREQRLPVDVFVIYTDNETWFGGVHPYKALQQYREATGIPAKLVVAGLTATQFTIADPHDAGSLDVVGFDAAAPAILADFARA